MCGTPFNAPRPPTTRRAQVRASNENEADTSNETRRAARALNDFHLEARCSRCVRVDKEFLARSRWPVDVVMFLALSSARRDAAAAN